MMELVWRVAKPRNRPRSPIDQLADALMMDAK
jgi:hypothetical protein